MAGIQTLPGRVGRRGVHHRRLSQRRGRYTLVNLMRLGYIEQFGTGIERIRRAMRAHGLPEPHFEAGPGWFRVTFPGPGEHIPGLIPEEGVTDPSASSGQALRALGLNARQIEALRLMVNEGKELTNQRYREQFQVAANTALRDLERLVQTGWVKRVSHGRATKYVASGLGGLS